MIRVVLRMDSSPFLVAFFGALLVSFFSLLPDRALAAEQVGSSGSGANASTQFGNVKCGISAEERKCRCQSDFGKKFATAEYEKYLGKPSGGLCLTGVETSFQKACGVPVHSWGIEGAKDSSGCYAQLGFEVHRPPEKIPDPPPPGTVFVYSGGEYGHVEVYSGKGVTGTDEYCSDYCSPDRRDAKGLMSGRVLTGWFIPTQEGC